MVLSMRGAESDFLSLSLTCCVGKAPASRTHSKRWREVGRRFARLVIFAPGRMLGAMKGKMVMPLVFMVVFALSRIPGMLPQNFSAAYALMFCAGVYFSGKMGWWLPLGTMLVTDIGLNLYYRFYLNLHVFDLSILKYQLFNYVAYAGLIWLGRRFKPGASFVALLGGGILGALLFYLVTNTASWFFNPFGNPEYTKTLFGWLTALTKGTAGWPETWQFFRNTLLSGGIFTGLFVAAMKMTSASESAREKESAPEPAEEPEGEDAGEQADTPKAA